MEWRDYQKEKLDEIFLSPDSIKTDIWCPCCCGPVYKDTTKIVASNPPKYRYYCGQCKWEEMFF